MNTQRRKSIKRIIEHLTVSESQISHIIKNNNDDEVENNPEKRDEIAKILEACHFQIDDCASELNVIIDDEQMSYDNLPENFQYSERGENMQNTIDALNDQEFELESLSDDISEILDDMEEYFDLMSLSNILKSIQSISKALFEEYNR